MEKFGLFFGGLFFFLLWNHPNTIWKQPVLTKHFGMFGGLFFLFNVGCWIKGENAFAKQKMGKIRSDFYCRHFCHQKVAKSKMVSFWISSWSLILKNRHPKKTCVASQNVQNPNWRENENTTMSRPRQDISWHISTNSVNISSSFFGIIFFDFIFFFGVIIFGCFLLPLLLELNGCLFSLLQMRVCVCVYTPRNRVNFLAGGHSTYQSECPTKRLW